LRDYAWANVATADNLNTRRRTLLGIPPGATMPFMLNCDSQPLLLETVLSTDTLLFSWSSWLQRHVDTAVVIDLGGRLVPRLPSTLLRVDCAVVYRADRTLLPAAQRLIGMIVDKGRSKASRKVADPGSWRPADPETPSA
jgi:DNA-binding transcriptional LysR family regulator